jgi:hypothetical protein
MKQAEYRTVTNEDRNKQLERWLQRGAICNPFASAVITDDFEYVDKICAGSEKFAVRSLINAFCRAFWRCKKVFLMQEDDLLRALKDDKELLGLVGTFIRNPKDKLLSRVLQIIAVDNERYIGLNDEILDKLYGKVRY